MWLKVRCCCWLFKFIEVLFKPPNKVPAAVDEVVPLPPNNDLLAPLPKRPPLAAAGFVLLKRLPAVLGAATGLAAPNSPPPVVVDFAPSNPPVAAGLAPNSPPLAAGFPKKRPPLLVAEPAGLVLKRPVEAVEMVFGVK